MFTWLMMFLLCSLRTAVSSPVSVAVKESGCVREGERLDDGAIWTESSSAGGGESPDASHCRRRVKACFAGRIITLLPDSQEHCNTSETDDRSPACRLDTFTTCCPVYDCVAKIHSVAGGTSIRAMISHGVIDQPVVGSADHAVVIPVYQTLSSLRKHVHELKQLPPRAKHQQLAHERLMEALTAAVLVHDKIKAGQEDQQKSGSERVTHVVRGSVTGGAEQEEIGVETGQGESDIHTLLGRMLDRMTDMLSQNQSVRQHAHGHTHEERSGVVRYESNQKSQSRVVHRKQDESSTKTLIGQLQITGDVLRSSGQDRGGNHSQPHHLMLQSRSPLPGGPSELQTDVLTRVLLAVLTSGRQAWDGSYSHLLRMLRVAAEEAVLHDDSPVSARDVVYTLDLLASTPAVLEDSQRSSLLKLLVLYERLRQSDAGLYDKALLKRRMLQHLRSVGGSTVRQLIRLLVQHTSENRIGLYSPPPQVQTANGTANVGEQCGSEGVAWTRVSPNGGARATQRCSRHVRGCQNGRVLAVNSAVYKCSRRDEGASQPLCAVATFFTCCPVFNCGEKLKNLMLLQNNANKLEDDIAAFLAKISFHDIARNNDQSQTVVHPTLSVGKMEKLLGGRKLSESDRRELLRVLHVFGRKPLPESDAVVEIQQMLMGQTDQQQIAPQAEANTQIGTLTNWISTLMQRLEHHPVSDNQRLDGLSETIVNYILNEASNEDPAQVVPSLDVMMHLIESESAQKSPNISFLLKELEAYLQNVALQKGQTAIEAGNIFDLSIFTSGEGDVKREPHSGDVGNKITDASGHPTLKLILSRILGLNKNKNDDKNKSFISWFTRQKIASNGVKTNNINEKNKQTSSELLHRFKKLKSMLDMTLQEFMLMKASENSTSKTDAINSLRFLLGMKSKVNNYAAEPKNARAKNPTKVLGILLDMPSNLSKTALDKAKIRNIKEIMHLLDISPSALPEKWKHKTLLYSSYDEGDGVHKDLKRQAHSPIWDLISGFSDNRRQSGFNAAILTGSKELTTSAESPSDFDLESLKDDELKYIYKELFGEDLGDISQPLDADISSVSKYLLNIFPLELDHEGQQLDLEMYLKLILDQLPHTGGKDVKTSESLSKVPQNTTTSEKKLQPFLNSLIRALYGHRKEAAHPKTSDDQQISISNEGTPDDVLFRMLVSIIKNNGNEPSGGATGRASFSELLHNASKNVSDVQTIGGLLTSLIALVAREAKLVEKKDENADGQLYKNNQADIIEILSRLGKLNVSSGTDDRKSKTVRFSIQALIDFLTGGTPSEDRFTIGIDKLISQLFNVSASSSKEQSLSKSDEKNKAEINDQSFIQIIEGLLGTVDTNSNSANGRHLSDENPLPEDGDLQKEIFSLLRYIQQDKNGTSKKTASDQTFGNVQQLIKIISTGTPSSDDNQNLNAKDLHELFAFVNISSKDMVGSDKKHRQNNELMNILANLLKIGQGNEVLFSTEGNNEPKSGKTEPQYKFIKFSIPNNHEKDSHDDSTKFDARILSGSGKTVPDDQTQTGWTINGNFQSALLGDDNQQALDEAISELEELVEEGQSESDSDSKITYKLMNSMNGARAADSFVSDDITSFFKASGMDALFDRNSNPSTSFSVSGYEDDKGPLANSPHVEIYSSTKPIRKNEEIEAPVVISVDVSTNDHNKKNTRLPSKSQKDVINNEQIVSIEVLPTNPTIDSILPNWGSDYDSLSFLTDGVEGVERAMERERLRKQDGIDYLRQPKFYMVPGESTDLSSLAKSSGLFSTNDGEHELGTLGDEQLTMGDRSSIEINFKEPSSGSSESLVGKLMDDFNSVDLGITSNGGYLFDNEWPGAADNLGDASTISSVALKSTGEVEAAKQTTRSNPSAADFLLKLSQLEPQSQWVELLQEFAGLDDEIDNSESVQNASEPSQEVSHDPSNISDTSSPRDKDFNCTETVVQDENSVNVDSSLSRVAHHSNVRTKTTAGVGMQLLETLLRRRQNDCNRTSEGHSSDDTNQVINIIGDSHLIVVG